MGQPDVTSDAPSVLMLTASGRAVDLLNPDPRVISIEDIAASLSRISRFGGHLRDDVETYTVAQHSVLVSQMVPPEMALVGLLHDAAEAYLGDVVSPLKRLLPGYAALEIAWAMAIGSALGLGVRLIEQPPEVVEADARAMATEARDLLADTPARRAAFTAEPFGIEVVPLPPSEARHAFLARFERLVG